MQRHCTENSEQIFQEMRLGCLVRNFHIHESVSNLHIRMIVRLFCCSKIGGSIVGIYKLLTDLGECGNWERGRAVSFLGIHKSDLVCSACGLQCRLIYYVRSSRLHFNYSTCRMRMRLLVQLLTLLLGCTLAEKGREKMYKHF